MLSGQKDYAASNNGFTFDTYFYMTEVPMISRRKILLVVGVAVAIIIGVYTGVFGMNI